MINFNACKGREKKGASGHQLAGQIECEKRGGSCAQVFHSNKLFRSKLTRMHPGECRPQECQGFVSQISIIPDLPHQRHSQMLHRTPASHVKLVIPAKEPRHFLQAEESAAELVSSVPGHLCCAFSFTSGSSRQVTEILILCCPRFLHIPAEYKYARLSAD